MGAKGPAILGYREALQTLTVIELALIEVKVGRTRREWIDKAIMELRNAFFDAQRKFGGKGLPLKLSRMWPQVCNDDGTRKDENAPDPTPGKMEDRGQGGEGAEAIHHDNHKPHSQNAQIKRTTGDLRGRA